MMIGMKTGLKFLLKNENNKLNSPEKASFYCENLLVVKIKPMQGEKTKNIASKSEIIVQFFLAGEFMMFQFDCKEKLCGNLKFFG